MSDTIDRFKARKSEKLLSRCKHFNGMFINKTCRAGVDYEAAFGSAPGVALRAPCFPIERADPPMPCLSLELPTADEVEAEMRADDEAVSSFLSDLRANRCPTCKREVKLVQNGACVYGDCGHRLYHGKVKKVHKDLS